MKLFESGLHFNLSQLFSQVFPIAVKVIFLAIAFLIVLPVGKSIITKVIERTGKNRKISAGRIQTLEKLLKNIFGYFMIFLFITMLFAILHIPIGPLLASAGIVGLAIGFGAQGIVSDIVTGFFILLERQIDVDDYITISGLDGIVEEVGLRTTQVRSFDGTLNFVPNRQITNVSNHSRGNMRAMIDLTVQHENNLDETITKLEHLCAEFQHDERFKDGPNVLGVQSLGSQDLVLRIVGQTENGMQWACERDLRKRIKDELHSTNV